MFKFAALKKINKLMLILLIVYLIDLNKHACVSAENNVSKRSAPINNKEKDLANKKFDGDDDDDDNDKKIIKEKLSNSKDDSESKEQKDGHEHDHGHHDHPIGVDLGFVHAFLASLSVILVSEIGDKTFFIAAIMAMKHPRMVVYSGAIFALGLMTLLSALLGNIVTKVIPRVYTYYFSSFLFAIFGLKMMREGLQMSKDENTDEEYEEAQQSLKKSEEDENSNSAKNLEAGLSGGPTPNSDKNEEDDLTRKIVVSLRKYISPIFLQAFILTFLAEWGDRSQISTIILGARENMAGTIIGGTIGHAICTGMAVIGGRFVAQRISVRNVTLCGAVVFLFFALSAFFIDPE